jgi:hypothetical protein
LGFNRVPYERDGRCSRAAEGRGPPPPPPRVQRLKAALVDMEAALPVRVATL